MNNFKLCDFIIETYDSNPSAWISSIPRGVRITHKPTGLITQCETHNTLHKNRVAYFEEFHKRINKTI